MTSYTIETGEGLSITTGVQGRETAQRIAQRHADESGEPVVVYSTTGREVRGEWTPAEMWTVAPTARVLARVRLESALSHVRRWIVPPICQGQIVEVAYGDSHDGTVWRRITDRSDRSVSYARADVTDCGCADECDCWDPANSKPVGYDWEVVS